MLRPNTKLHLYPQLKQCIDQLVCPSNLIPPRILRSGLCPRCPQQIALKLCQPLLVVFFLPGIIYKISNISSSITYTNRDINSYGYIILPIYWLLHQRCFQIAYGYKDDIRELRNLLFRLILYKCQQK